MEYPMRADLQLGSRFPDFELPDQAGEVKRLNQLLRGFPGVLVFAFDERFGLLVDAEYLARENRGLATLLRDARLRAFDTARTGRAPSGPRGRGPPAPWGATEKGFMLTIPRMLYA